MNIAIVGAGIGGLALATLAQREGHQVCLWERFDQPRPVGSGLVIQPVGLAVLDRLGVGDQARAMGAPMIPVPSTATRLIAIASLPPFFPAPILSPPFYGAKAGEAACQGTRVRAPERRRGASPAPRRRRRPRRRRKRDAGSRAGAGQGGGGRRTLRRKP